MLYTLRLIAKDIRPDDVVFEGATELHLNYPIDGHFASHNAVGTSLSTLVPLLLGEVMMQINEQVDKANEEERAKEKEEV